MPIFDIYASGKTTPRNVLKFATTFTALEVRLDVIPYEVIPYEYTESLSSFDRCNLV